MLQPEILEKEQAIIPPLRFAFRPLFILPSLLSVIAVVVWVAILKGDVQWSASLAANIWHGHEMIFGFAATVAFGFLLTAAQTWTGVRSIKGWNLGVVVILWLVARIAFLSQSELFFIVGIISEASWLAICVGYFTYMVVKSNNRRNFIFVPLLSLISILNIATLLSAFTGEILVSSHLSYSAVFLVSTMVTVVGGRVIPFFTTRSLDLKPIIGNVYLERTIAIMMFLSTLGFISSYLFSSSILLASCFILTGCLQIFRMKNWQTKKTFSTPLLWSLHLSYLNMGIGFILLGTSYITHDISFSSAIHTITVGTIGTMIIAMMSRVSLGHTGRPLQINTVISLSFLLLLSATLFRVLFPLIGWLMQGYIFSAACWAIGFSIFIYYYAPILMRARPDGRSG